jgi:uncharacterized membrane protein YeiH
MRTYMQFDLPSQTLYAASLVGGVAFALSGFLAGVRKGLDLMGIFILSFLTANGGGVIRDILVGRPVTLVHEAEPFFITSGVVLLALLLKLHKLPQLEQRLGFVVSDAIGLAAFGLSGALVGIEVQAQFFGVLALSLLTAAGGGILRDLLVNEVPELLSGGFYGSVALLQGAAICGLQAAQSLNTITLLAAFCAALALRLVAYRGKWRLPKPARLVE